MTLELPLGHDSRTRLSNKISGKALIEINKKVGFKLLTKFGEKGIINLGKMLPLVGGLIGGTFESLATHSVGRIALGIFAGNSSGEPRTQAAASE